MKEVATAPGASAAILDWARVDELGAMSEYYRIKVFTDEGKKFADVEVPYFASYPSNGDVTNINARTIHPDGSIVPFDGKVYDKLLYKGSHGVVRAKTFSLADVRPGSILEYHYVVRWSSYLLSDTEWIIQKDIPIEHASFSLTAYDGPEFGSFFTYSALPPGVMPARTTARNKFGLEMSHVPPYREEPYSLPAAQVKPRVAFYYTSSHIRPGQFWESQPKIWQKEIEAFLGRSGDLSATVTSTLGVEQDANEKLRKLYGFVQTLKNLSTDSSVTTIKDATGARDVIANKGGSSHELTRTFVALARSAGFDADVVRVAPRDERFFSDKIPDAEQMSAEAAVVTVGGKPLFLDPGTPHAPFGLLSWEKSNVPAIRFTKSGPQWVKTPLDPPSGAMLQRKADLRLDGDTLKGTIAITFRGQEALIRRLRGDDETARKKAIEDEIKGWFPNGAVLNVKSADGLSSDDGAIVVNCDAELPGIVSRAGSRLMVPLSVFAASAKNPFAASTRTGILYFHYPRQEDDEVKLTLPPKYTAGSHPPPQSLNAGSFRYEMTVEDHGSELTMKRSEIIDATFVDPAQYSGVRMFFNAATMADQRPLLINPPAE
ncbi:MAG TPA: DUF3857 domain-containing protein [Thermoanaerobaculia bacterium]|nr:DUF3857 domain-containing protein [Thermoanaerobaculia bacterium]